MVRKMDDSHTKFLPPWQTLEPRFGFQVKPFGDTVRAYKIKEKGPAEKAGLLVGDTVLGIDRPAMLDLNNRFHDRLAKERA